MTISERLEVNRAPHGFDYLRIVLAIGVVVWHSFMTTYGRDYGRSVWDGPVGPLFIIILPMFFGLSGFLVAGSLQRSRTIEGFLTLRVIRIIPALAVETLLSALILGPLLTTLPLAEYLSAPEFRSYFLNMIGWIHYYLPGVFVDNPRPKYVNLQLWTVPFELECYLALVVLTIVGVSKRRNIFLAVTLLLTIGWPLQRLIRGVFHSQLHLPGRLLVLSFLAGVCIYLFRDKIRLSGKLAGICAVAGVALLYGSWTQYFVVWPAVYLTVWLGLTNPPKLPLLMNGDYSYGVYLFGFPIQQALMQLFPHYRTVLFNIAFAVPLALLYAAFSWHLVEKPVLDRKKKAVTVVEGLRARQRRGAKNS